MTVRVIEGRIILIQNNLKGNENCFENCFELDRARVTEGKVTVYDGPRISILVRVSTEGKITINV